MADPELGLIARQELRRAANPLALFCNGIGDHILTLPAIRALAEMLGGRLTLACLPGARELFFADLPLAGVCELRTTSVENGVISFDADDLAARVTHCDLLVYLNRAVTDCVGRVQELLVPEASVGLFPQFDYAVPFRRGVHAADLAFEIPRILDPSLTIDSFAQPLGLPPEYRLAAKQFRALLPPGTRVMAVHTETARDKMWPIGCFQAALSAFLERHPEFWILLVGEHEPALKAPRMLSCCGVELPMSLAIVSEASCFLGVDSCLLHAADLCGVPGVGLFGPTSPEEFGFRFSSGVHVRSGETMQAISEADVLHALEGVTAVLAGTQP